MIVVAWLIGLGLFLGGFYLLFTRAKSVVRWSNWAAEDLRRYVAQGIPERCSYGLSRASADLGSCANTSRAT